MSRTRIFALLLFAIFMGAIAINRLIPPFQSPDETVHLLRADMISRGQWLLQPQSLQSKGREGGLVDVHTAMFSEVMLTLVGGPHEDNPARELMNKADQVGWSGKTKFVLAAGTGYYTPLIYTPHALGLGVGRLLNLSMLDSYMLARALVIAASLAMLVWAFTLYAPNMLMVMLLLMPMSVFQWLSPTIDGLCASLAVLLIGLWVSLPQRHPTAHFSRQEGVLYLCIFMLCTTRTNMLPTLLIPLLLLAQHHSRARALAVLALFGITMGWILFATLTVHDARVVRGISTTDVLLGYLGSPGEFFGVMQRTLGEVSIRKFYRQSFVGFLGWLDTPIPKQAVRDLWSALGICIVVMLATLRLWRPWVTRLGLLIIGIGSAVLVLFALAVTWNLYPAVTLMGVQGRYFIIPALFTAAALGRLAPSPQPYRWYEVLMMGIFGCYSLYVLVQTLQNRYLLTMF